MQCALVGRGSRMGNAASAPPTLPRVSFSTQSLSKDMKIDSSVGIEALRAPLQTATYRRMQPPIIHLAGHAGFVVRPPIEQCFKRLEALGGSTPWCGIIDMSSVRHLETCVARSVAKLVSGIAAQPTPGLLVIVKPAQSQQVLTSLRRGGLDLRQAEGVSIAEPYLGSSTSSAPIVCDDLVQAIRVFRNQTRDAPTISSMILRPLGSQHEGLPTAEIQGVADELLRYLPRTHSLSDACPELAVRPHERIVRAGLVIREIQRGDAISCSHYPLQHVFMVLRGQVILDASHHDRTRAAPLRPIRAAISAGMKAMLCSLRSRVRRVFLRKQRTAEASVMREYLKAFDWFDAGLSASCCAYASHDHCWILDVDPNNEVGALAAKRAAQQLKARKL